MYTRFLPILIYEKKKRRVPNSTKGANSMRKVALVGVVVLLTQLVLMAQENPRVEAAAMYSFVRFSPSAKYTPNLNLNGGGGSVTYNFSSYLGVKAELDGYAGSQATFIIPTGDPICPPGCRLTGDANLFTYVFGPQLKLRMRKIQPYFHVLLGGAHTTAFARAEAACTGVCQPIATGSRAAGPSDNAFAMTPGGGIDVPIGHTIALRVGQFDYLITRFKNRFDTTNQHNFRFSAGMVFNFGG
jgi:hypothetical protein